MTTGMMPAHDEVGSEVLGSDDWSCRRGQSQASVPGLVLQTDHTDMTSHLAPALYFMMQP